MADFENLEKEAFLFAEDLFSDIMSVHPMFRVYLPEHSPTPAKSSHFTRAVSKSVMVICHELRNDLKFKFRRDFNSFSKGDAALKAYLEHLCSIVRKNTTCKIRHVLGLSAVLLELIAILYRRGYTFFLSKAPIYWLLMFKNIAFDDFHAIGGWEGLTALSKKFEIDYDKSANAIYWEYWHSDSMPWIQHDQGSGKNSNSTEASSGIVTDFASTSVITVKAEFDTVSKDKIGTDFEVGKPLKDPVTPKTLEQTKELLKKMTPEDKALGSKEQERKPVISESRKTPLEKTTLPKDKIRTDFEVRKPLKDPVTPKTPEQTKEPFKKMTPEDKALGSKEQERKLPISERRKSLLGKKDVSSRPGDASSKKSGSIPSTTSSRISNLSKMDSGTVHSTPAPRSERRRTTSMQSSSQKAVTATSAKVAKSGPALPVGQGATGKATSASGQNVSQDICATEPEDLNTSAKEKAIKKDASASSPKPKPVKKVSKPQWR